MTTPKRARKAAPMTVRLPEELDQWVRAKAEGRSGGQSAVIEEAVTNLRDLLEDNTELIHKTIVGRP